MPDAPPKLETPLQATLAGIRDRFGGGPTLVLNDDERLDGKVVLITGANRGLGYGIATRLAERGATLLLACRSGGAEAAQRLRSQTGHAPIDALPLDLADPSSIDTLVQTLTDRQTPLDRLVLNAGVVPLASRNTAAGLDVMFHVNFLANVDLVDRLLAADRLARGSRVIVVSSESHRSGQPDLEQFGTPEPYGTSGVMPHYGQSKLYLTTWARDLARRLPADSVGVFTVCPGAVASDIAREAPGWMKVLLTPTMKLLFASPHTAAAPIEWLACTRDLDGQTGLYHHMHRLKDPAPFAADPDEGERVHRAAMALLKEIR